MVAFIFFVSLVFLLRPIKGSAGDYVALIKIEDVIFEDDKIESLFEKVCEDNGAKALIIAINSPGGSSVGSEKYYKLTKKIASKKPVVALMGTLATSGGYMIALGADYIVSQNMTLTGAIGVVMQTYELTEAAEKLGIKLHSFKSSPLKATPNPYESVTQQVTDATMSTINDSYEYFVQLLMENRKMDINKAKELADGRVYTGRQAVQLGLVDQIGMMDEVRAWLQKEKQISDQLPAEEVKNDHDKSSLLDILSSKYLGGWSKNMLQSLLNKLKSSAILLY